MDITVITAPLVTLFIGLLAGWFAKGWFVENPEDVAKARAELEHELEDVKAKFERELARAKEDARKAQATLVAGVQDILK